MGKKRSNIKKLARFSSKKPKLPTKRKPKRPTKPPTKHPTKRKPKRPTKPPTKHPTKRKPKRPTKRHKPRAIPKRSLRRLRIGLKKPHLGSNQGTVRTATRDEGKANARFEVSYRAGKFWSPPNSAPNATFFDETSTWLEKTTEIATRKIGERMGRFDSLLVIGWKWHLENLKTGDARSAPHFDEQLLSDLSHDYKEVTNDLVATLKKYVSLSLSIRGLEIYVRTLTLPGKPPPTNLSAKRSPRRRKTNPKTVPNRRGNRISYNDASSRKQPKRKIRR